MSSKQLSFEIPEIVNPSGGEGSPHRRPMNYTTDETRESTVKETGGQPRIDFEGTSNPYINYESIDLLLSLQHPRSEGYDEMCFILSGQCLGPASFWPGAQKAFFDCRNKKRVFKQPD